MKDHEERLAWVCTHMIDDPTQEFVADVLHDSVMVICKAIPPKDHEMIRDAWETLCFDCVQKKLLHKTINL